MSVPNLLNFLVSYVCFQFVFLLLGFLGVGIEMADKERGTTPSTSTPSQTSCSLSGPP